MSFGKINNVIFLLFAGNARARESDELTVKNFKRWGRLFIGWEKSVENCAATFFSAV